MFISCPNVAYYMVGKPFDEEKYNMMIEETIAKHICDDALVIQHLTELVRVITRKDPQYEDWECRLADRVNEFIQQAYREDEGMELEQVCEDCGAKEVIWHGSLTCQC